MPDHHIRLAMLRAELDRAGLDGFILAVGDEHITEYPAPYARRLHWLTDFGGSAGSIAVLRNQAAIFVDGRYTDSVRIEVDAANWSYEAIPQTSIGTWLAENAPAEARIGYDPKLYTRAALRAISDKLGATTADLVPLPTNPVDPVWTGQPTRPHSPVFVQPIDFSGKSAADKRCDVSDWLVAKDADACVLVALTSIAWLFNIRGRDTEVAPLTYAFAICHRDGTADLFIDSAKVDKDVREHLGSSVRIAPYDAFYPAVSALGGKTVSVDPDLSPVAVYDALEQAGAVVRDDRDPTILPRARKNPVEIEGMRQAHIRDGAALTRFLHWLSVEAPQGELTELAAAAKLSGFRREDAMYHGPSFQTISAVDGNAALPHYRPSEKSDAPIRPDSIYLVDSGGHYPDGTTDVTRTVAIGKAPPEVKDRFTRVLQAYIALQTASFPVGTPGSRLDAVARVPLWAAGIDCAHGIGHGVGHFLNVHEGPAYFAPVARPNEAPVEAGMILSNEPGYYKSGEYGIRTENLVLVVERTIAGADRPMLGMEPLTFAPIDRKLIDTSLLTRAEVEWLNQYHARVAAMIGSLLSDTERAWLTRQIAPIEKSERESHAQWRKIAVSDGAHRAM
jgi:Xaa-Pro aminopeptidase